MIPLLLNVAAVLFMTGFIWTMQLLHYPLLDRVGEDSFSRYETDHNRLFGRVAGPGVLLTLVSAVLLLFVRPSGIPVAAAVADLGLQGRNSGLHGRIPGSAALQTPARFR